MKKTKFRSKVAVDKVRAKNVLRPLYAAYEEQKQLFAHISRESNAPQRRFFPSGVPKGGIEHRVWLFFAAMTDRREESENVYGSHVRLWDKEPRLYSEHVTRMHPADIAALLGEERVGFPRQSARYWPRCAETLFGSFGGDPLRMYQELKFVDAILAFKNGSNVLPGFGPKILSLLSLFLEDLGLMSMPPDAFPVDVHVQRVAISTGIVIASGAVVNEDVELALRPLLCEICLEEQWKPLELAHALWFLGNRCCSGCYRKKEVELLCPAYQMCKGGISTLSYNNRGMWEMDALRHNRGGARVFFLPPSPLFPSEADAD